MKRALLSQLINWKNNPKRKPLLLMGARQVGKTTLLRRFASTEYIHHIYLNFEEQSVLKALFASISQPDAIIKAIELEMDTVIVPEQTLLIFDEIQECPEALNALKYFQEHTIRYSICAAGSLLGVKLAHTKGFPVGKVQFLTLYPLSFFEFLTALSQTHLVEHLQTLETVVPLPENIHLKLLEYFKTYLFIGGMPEAVSEYVSSKDFAQVRRIQQAILKAYDLDFAKHVPKDMIMKISLIWTAIPGQLAKENKKFIYSFMRKGARAKDFETALQWLNEAGLIHKVSNITIPKIPLEGYALFDFFKVYLLDVGLLGAMTQLSPKAIIHGEALFQEFQGSFVENYIAQELVHVYEKLYYWTSEGKAQLDFIIQSHDVVCPLEVKSGVSAKKKSLQVYEQMHTPRLMIRASPMNLKHDGAVLNCPLYLIGEVHRLIQLELS